MENHKLKPFGRQVAVWVPEHIRIGDEPVENTHNDFGMVTDDFQCIMPETGEEIELKAGDWVALGQSTEKQIGEQKYCGVDITRVVGIVDAEVEVKGISEDWSNIVGGQDG